MAKPQTEWFRASWQTGHSVPGVPPAPGLLRNGQPAGFIGFPVKWDTQLTLFGASPAKQCSHLIDQPCFMNGSTLGLGRAHQNLRLRMAILLAGRVGLARRRQAPHATGRATCQKTATSKTGGCCENRWPLLGPNEKSHQLCLGGSDWRNRGLC